MRENVRERDTVCGEFKRVNLYPVHKPAKRSPRAVPTTEVQAKLNEENSRNRLIDLIHTNFTPDDMAVHLTYEDGQMPESAEAAGKLVYNYVRRLARVWSAVCGRDRSEFKYIIVTEMSSTGRIHHHCLISGGLPLETISDKWGLGHTQARALEFDENGLTGLSVYITKSRVGYRRWQGSKNLSKPAVRENDYKIRKKDVKYISENPDDVWYIEQLHGDGWRVCPGSIKVLSGDCLGAGFFVSYMMYRENNAYFERDKKGRLKQKRRRRVNEQG